MATTVEFLFFLASRAIWCTALTMATSSEPKQMDPKDVVAARLNDDHVLEAVCVPFRYHSATTPCKGGGRSRGGSEMYVNHELLPGETMQPSDTFDLSAEQGM